MRVRLLKHFHMENSAVHLQANILEFTKKLDQFSAISIDLCPVNLNLVFSVAFLYALKTGNVFCFREGLEM